MSAGKGDKRIPRVVDRKTYEDNWEKTFKRITKDYVKKKEKEGGK